MRILSYNMHKGIGGKDRKYRLERIIDVIENENPDVICLQEVDSGVKRSKHHHQPDLLADYFKFAERLYQKNVKLKEGGYGNLILSRWPFLSHHQISLKIWKKKNRGAQIVVIDTPEGKLHLVNFHLGLMQAERKVQVEKLITHQLFKEGAEHPTLIIGDTNDWRSLLEKTAFQKHEFEEVTRPPSKFRSFPAWKPVGSLDKAFIRGAIVVRHARIAHSATGRAASDHLPLVLDIHLDHDPLDDVDLVKTG